jgi:hypothetical protein
LNTIGSSILIAIIGIAMIASASILPMSSLVLAKSKDSKAKDAIVKAVGKSVEGKWSKIDEASYSLFDSNSTITPYNKTKVGPVTPPLPPSCKTGDHLQDGKCVPDVKPAPGNVTRIALVGDIKGTSVRDAIAKENPDVVIGLGDLGYEATLSGFKSNYINYFNDKGVAVKCLIGNHEDTEDGSAALLKEASATCGAGVWWLKIGTSTLFIGVNTNGNLDTQLGIVQDLIMNETFMAGVTSLHYESHKPICATPPNSHHPLELDMTFCNNLIVYTPGTVQLYFDNGHNHVMGESVAVDGILYKTIGSGGKSHYECGKNTIWIFCNNTDNGFYMYEIDNTSGATTGSFISTAGKIIK